MTFESLWPLFFLAAIPIIIILYLLKPRGVDHRISSNLLWKKILQNQQSKTFFEKFTHNILMYLQILIMILFAIALMSPYVSTTGEKGGRKILLVDTSASMQHTNEKGESLFDLGIEEACAYIRNTTNTSISIVTCDHSGVNLLAIDSTDTSGLITLLKGLRPSDCGGDLNSAHTMISQLSSASEEGAELMVLTDAAGTTQLKNLTEVTISHAFLQTQNTDNVSNDYMAFSVKADGTADIMVSTTNHSDTTVTFDVSLLNSKDQLLQINQQTLLPNATDITIFSGITLNDNALKSTISGFSYNNGSYDSLPGDNISYVINKNIQPINAIMFAESNTFLERAYAAITGTPLVKTSTAGPVSEEYNVVIRDASFTSDAVTTNTLSFKDQRLGNGEIKNVMLSFVNSDLTSGLKDFSIGVNSAITYELPDWGNSFLECGDQCVGYYGEHDGIREIVVGFDIRESDFPLKGEFPVFLSNCFSYLSDTSILAKNTYYAGDALSFHPWALDDPLSLSDLTTNKAGLYSIASGDSAEQYVVRFSTSEESDNRVSAEEVKVSAANNIAMVKKTLRTIFLIAAFVLLLLEWILYVKQVRYKGKFYLVVRIALMLLLLLAILDLKISLPSGPSTTIFVVDLSNSNESHLNEMSDYLKENINKMPSRNQYGIICFGKNAIIDQFLSHSQYYNGIMSLPEKTASNFEDALGKAVAMLPNNSNGRLVILSDGKETRGNMQNLSHIFSPGKIELLSLKYENEQQKDAYIGNVTMPSYLHPGDRYSVTVTIESNYETDGKIGLYHSSILSEENAVHINKGTNRFSFQQTVLEDTTETLSVILTATDDSCEENNVYTAYSVVEAPPKVLVVAGRNAKTGNFTALLSSGGVDYSLISSYNTPTTIDELLQFKTVILVNTYLDELSEEFLDLLDPYVKNYGCGLVCTGGMNSYALGGYRDSILETILPVSMTPQNVNELPTMCMCMIIDHSGSMDSEISPTSRANKLDLAISAACVAVDNLRSNDYVGVLTFDDQYTWQVPIQQNSDSSTIKNSIKQIPNGGGTSIKPALKEAYKKVSTSDAQIKHIVLLTDGQGETDDYDDIISSINNTNITLSTVAVGSDSDTKLLERLANSCSGRYYYADLASDLPQIFAQEVYLGGGTFIREGEFPLSVKTGHQLTQGIFQDGWPVLNGYVAATPKSAATCLMTAGDVNDPILTYWQYGLGRTVAWNSDVSGEWSGGFSFTDDSAQLWKRIVEYTAGNIDMGSDVVNILQNGDQTSLSFTTEEYDSNTKILATAIAPNGDVSEITLHATAPGVYETSMDTDQNGIYHFNIRRMDNDQIASYMTTAAAVQFSDEYKFDIDTSNYDAFIKKYGKEIDEKHSVWNASKQLGIEKKSIFTFLMTVIILLLLMDIAFRRFYYEPKFLARIPLLFTSLKASFHKKETEGTPVKATSEKAGDAKTSSDEASDNSPVEDQPKSSSTKKKKEKPKKQEEPEATLDTSTLLKKKDDRKL